MKRSLVVLTILAAAAWVPVPASAATITFTGTSGSLSASAGFAVSAGNLVVTLTNTSSADTLVPSDLLTGVFFAVAGGPALSPVSAILGPGSTVLFDPDGQPAGGNVGGEWVYEVGALPGGGTQGIASSGYGPFGVSASYFNGPDLDSPAAVNGMNYGLLSAGYVGSGNNPQVTGNIPLVKNQVIFTLSGFGTLDPSQAISNVWFQYGTAFTEPGYPGNPCVPGTPGCGFQTLETVPEPGSLLLLASGLALTAHRLRRRARR